MGKTGSFKYVYIPADGSEPLQELSLSYTEDDEVQCLLSTLRVSCLTLWNSATQSCFPPARIYHSYVNLHVHGMQDLHTLDTFAQAHGPDM